MLLVPDSLRGSPRRRNSAAPKSGVLRRRSPLRSPAALCPVCVHVVVRGWTPRRIRAWSQPDKVVGTEYKLTESEREEGAGDRGRWGERKEASMTEKTSAPPGRQGSQVLSVKTS